jgi:diadenosine tetraphosphate (Ap4A) HIT family hydrolase
MVACLSCQNNDLAAELPLRERLYLDDNWRVTHGWSALPGWLCVISRRHVESLAELEASEVASLGHLLRAASAALYRVVESEKTYVMLFAEAEGHQHVHFHVVPRMDDFTSEDRGPGVFRFLNVPESEQVSPEERDRLASLIREEIITELG